MIERLPQIQQINGLTLIPLRFHPFLRVNLFNRFWDYSSVHQRFVSAWSVILGEDAVHGKINVIVRLRNEVHNFHRLVGRRCPGFNNHPMHCCCSCWWSYTASWSRQQVWTAIFWTANWGSVKTWILYSTHYFIIRVKMARGKRMYKLKILDLLTLKYWSAHTQRQLSALVCQNCLTCSSLPNTSVL